MTSLDLSRVPPGFRDPVHQSQACFRAVMDAMARPGSVRTVAQGIARAPEGLDAAAASLALTLLDFEASLWLDPSLRGGEAETFLRFHCGCPLTSDAKSAAFAIAPVGSAHARLDAFNIGEEKSPERSTTVIWLCPSLAGGPRLSLRGPGIKDRNEISPIGLPADFLDQWRDNQAMFQCGVDLILTSGTEAIALPRSVLASSIGD